ncbi:MAG TPA: trehalose-phosphatase [Vicinamibacterales bacterium]|jgi:trehalose 6-phosphate phosphatase|nr:trehalose-phosphatase [Vicinamibacterales bacterium]
MPNILDRRHVSTLAHFAASNVLIAFDFDGTLSAITPTPQRARMRASTRRLLRAVAERYPCVVISGRRRADVARRMASVPLWHIAGNHGVEPWGEKEIYATRVREWAGPLKARLATHKGVVLEDKTYSLTVHYRRARHKARAVKAITDAVHGLRGARIMGGHYAINLVPRGAPHKGIALERLRSLLVCDTIIYVGDDDTDEDAFRAGAPDRLLAVRVGVKRNSGARHWLRSQADVDRFLLTLLSMRPLRYPQPSPGRADAR